jgi:purine catabolism regulator
VKAEEVVEFAEALARITASGGGAKALAAHLAQVTHGGVLLEDAKWRHIASAGDKALPPSAKSVVESSAPGKAQRVTSGDAHVAWLSLFGNNSGVEADLLLRLTAAAIGAELARDGQPRAKRGSFWSVLLFEGFSDVSAAREEAAAHGIALAPQYCVVALEAETVGESTPAAAALELRALAGDVFRSGDAELGFCEREQSLFVCVPASRAVDASNAKTAALLLPRTAARKKTALRVSGGVGTIETLASVARSAATAQAAANIARRLFGAGHVAAYDELGAYALLYEGAGLERMREFASGVLAPLRAYDEKHQTELERTLKLYFTAGQNIKSASEQLNVHRHTIFYRLRQIAEITSRSLESPHDQLAFRMAVAIDELHG